MRRTTLAAFFLVALAVGLAPVAAAEPEQPCNQDPRVDFGLCPPGYFGPSYVTACGQTMYFACAHF